MCTLDFSEKTNLIIENIEPKDDSVDVHKVITICKNLETLQNQDKVLKPIILIGKQQTLKPSESDELTLTDVLSVIEENCTVEDDKNHKVDKSEVNVAKESAVFDILQSLRFSPHTCIQCNINFKTAFELDAHKWVCKRHIITQHEDEDDVNFFQLNSETTEVSFMCHICNELFRTKVALRKHLQQHDVNSDDSTMDSESDNEDIFVELAEDPIFQCPLCKDFFKREPFDQHIFLCMFKHKTNTIECPLCQNKYLYENYNQHRAECIKNNKPLCLLPKVQEITQKNLNVPPSKKLHYKNVCQVCDKRFQTKQKLEHHSRVHQKKLCCEICAKIFENKQLLEQHRLSKHDNSKNICLQCGKSFSNRRGLYEHKRVHKTDPILFTCEPCGKYFTSKQGFFIHRRMHNGEKPFSCETCKKTFRDKGTLTKHRRIHSGEKPYCCPLCSKSFTQKTTLRDHLRSVHCKGNIEFLCDICAMNFQDLEELVGHLVKHSDEKRNLVLNLNKKL